MANSGKDSNPGTSASRPWRTLARVNSSSFLPGDSVQLQRGSIWREQLVPPSSGKSGRPIVFSAYGAAGANPVVTGADLLSGFVSGASAGQWCVLLPIKPNVVFISGALAEHQASASRLSKAGQWSWTSGTLCVFSTSGAPVQVEAAQRDFALLLGQTGTGSYVTITGIDFRIANMDTVHISNTSGDVVDKSTITGAYQFGIFAIGVNGVTVNHLMVSNSTIAFHGSSGIEISSGHNTVTIRRNLVFNNAYNGQNTENFQYMGGIYLYSNVQIVNNDLVEYNVSHDNGVKGGTESQGTGIWLDTLGGSTAQYNVAYNNLSYGLYFEKNVNSVMLNNLAYSNASAPNSANIACYADFGMPATGNTVKGNISWNSKGWGMKLGAFQGGGATRFQANTVENNVVLNSAAQALFVDVGANNNTANGSNNRYLSNSFGRESAKWIYWNGVGKISTYGGLQSAYGASLGSTQIDSANVLKILNTLPVSAATIRSIMASISSQ